MANLLSVMTRRSKPETNLGNEDRVILFPSLGHLSPDGQHWVVNIHGDVSAAGKITLSKRMLLKLLQRSMRATREDFATDIFRSRIERFLALDRPGKRIAVRIGEQEFLLPKRSRKNGHFQSPLRIPVRNVHQEIDLDGAAVGRLPMDVRGAATACAATGCAYLLPRTGLSIISDIDDTIKNSHVACKKSLLTNTFLRPFVPVRGMASIYRQWQNLGAAFHYVSSSPWQLYEHLAAHLADEGFPDGSFHLRSFRLRDHLLRRLLMVRRTGKAGILRTLFKTFPQRRFILVGDSGEHDPELYGAIARRYPQQVAGIFIRQLDQPAQRFDRYHRAFRRVAPTQVTIFRDAEELAAQAILQPR